MCISVPWCASSATNIYYITILWLIGVAHFIYMRTHSNVYLVLLNEMENSNPFDRIYKSQSDRKYDGARLATSIYRLIELNAHRAPNQNSNCRDRRGAQLTITTTSRLCESVRPSIKLPSSTMFVEGANVRAFPRARNMCTTYIERQSNWTHARAALIRLLCVQDANRIRRAGSHTYVVARRLFDNHHAMRCVCLCIYMMALVVCFVGWIDCGPFVRRLLESETLAATV